VRLPVDLSDRRSTTSYTFRDYARPIHVGIASWSIPEIDGETRETCAREGFHPPRRSLDAAFIDGKSVAGFLLASRKGSVTWVAETVDMPRGKISPGTKIRSTDFARLSGRLARVLGDSRSSSRSEYARTKNVDAELHCNIHDGSLRTYFIKRGFRDSGEFTNRRGGSSETRETMSQDDVDVRKRIWCNDIL